jgi:hypothetical protein
MTDNRKAVAGVLFFVAFLFAIFVVTQVLPALIVSLPR